MANDTAPTRSEMIATTIVLQLGGLGKLRAMIGAHNLLRHESALSFRFKGSRSVNFCKVTLDPDDTYSVEIGQVRKKGLEYRECFKASGIYCDVLRETFERETGLYLSL